MFITRDLFEDHLVFLHFQSSVLATISEHTMLLEGANTKPPQTGVTSGPVSGAEIMRKLSKSHAQNDSALKIKVGFSTFLAVHCEIQETP